MSGLFGASSPSDSSGPAEALDRFFARAARRYDLQLPLERRGLEAAARLAGDIRGRRVADVAAGTGALAAALLARGGLPRELVLVDRSAPMLARARRRLDRRGGAAARRLRFVRGDATTLPFEDAGLDVIGMAYLLHLLPREDARRALSEALRVLRPGGRLVAVVHSSPAGRAGRAYRRAWRLVNRLSPGLVGGGPMRDAAGLVGHAGFRVEREVRCPGVYWSQVLLAVRP